MAKKPGKRRPADIPPPAAPPAAAPDPAAERAFVEGLIATGEAARPDEHGKLPPGATHELVVDPDGEPRAIRRRFSAY